VVVSLIVSRNGIFMGNLPSELKYSSMISTKLPNTSTMVKKVL